MPEEPKNEGIPLTSDPNTQAQPAPDIAQAPVEQPAETVAQPTSNESAPFAPQNQPWSTPTESVTPTPAALAIFGSGPAEPTSVTPPLKKRKKGLFVGLIAAGVVALLIGGGALAYNVWYQNPNKVVSDALVNAITAKTMSATGTIELKGADYTLKVDASGKNSLEANSTVAVKLDFSSDEFSYSVNGEGIFSSEGDIYVKLSDVKKLITSIEEQSEGEVSFEAFAGVIEKVDGQWIKIGKGDLGDVNEEYEKSQKCLADISKQLESDASFRKTVENETEAIYKAHPFVVVGDKLGSRTINGTASLGYTLTGDANIADEFFTKFGDSELGKKFKDCNKDIKFDDVINAEDAQDTDTITETQIWVSRFGHEITELNLKVDDKETSGTIVFNPVFNKNETIEIPSDVVPFSELQSDIEKAYEESFGQSSMSYPADTTYSTSEFN